MKQQLNENTPRPGLSDWRLLSEAYFTKNSRKGNCDFLCSRNENLKIHGKEKKTGKILRRFPGSIVTLCLHTSTKTGVLLDLKHDWKMTETRLLQDTLETQLLSGAGVDSQ